MNRLNGILFPVLLLLAACDTTAPPAGGAAAVAAAPAAPAAPAEPKVNVDDPEVLRGLLSELVGDKTEWSAARVSGLTAGMTCDEVRAVYPAMEDCKTDKTHAFPKAKIKGDPLVSGYKFTFRDGGLTSVTLLFHRHIDKDVFSTVSLEVFEGKWGALKPEKREKDILTWVTSDFGMVQRGYMVDHWELRTDPSDA